MNRPSLPVKLTAGALFLIFLACTGTPANDEPTTDDVAEVPTEEEAEPIVIDSSFTLDYVRGRFNPATHPDFTAVDGKYTDGDGTYYLRKDTYEAFKQMHAAAAADTVRLTIISATRNFNRQKSIWEAKWFGSRLLEGRESAPEVYPEPVDRALAILRWSSMPGTSRHHWGTDMDINRLTNDYFESGEGLKVYEWMTANAASFGFCQPYSPKGEDRPHGYNEEKWHWSYLPAARQLTELARTALSDQEIDGFEGSEVATAIGVVEKYVLGINAVCKE